MGRSRYIHFAELPLDLVQSSGFRFRVGVTDGTEVLRIGSDGGRFGVWLSSEMPELPDLSNYGMRVAPSPTFPILDFFFYQTHEPYDPDLMKYVGTVRLGVTTFHVFQWIGK